MCAKANCAPHTATFSSRNRSTWIEATFYIRICRLEWAECCYTVLYAWWYQRMCVWFLIRILQTFFSAFFFSYIVALFWQIFLCFLWIFDVSHKNSSAHTNEWMKYEIKNVAYLFRFVSVWGYSCCQSYIYLSFIFFVCFSCESCCLATVISIVFEHTINDVDNNWSVCDIRYFCFFFPALSLTALRRTTWHFI